MHSCAIDKAYYIILVANWPIMSGESHMRQLIQNMTRAMGFEIVRYRSKSAENCFAPDISEEDRTILSQIVQYS